MKKNNLKCIVDVLDWVAVKIIQAPLLVGWLLFCALYYLGEWDNPDRYKRNCQKLYRHLLKFWEVL